MAGMQIMVRSGYSHFKIGQTPHAAVDRRNFLRNHRRVRDKNDISPEPVLVVSDPGCKGWTAYFLFSFEYELDIMVQLPGPDLVLECLDVHEKLALVVIRSPAPDSVTALGILADHGFEWVGDPFVKRFRRLYIIVPIDKYRLPFRIDDFLPENHRIAITRIDSGLVCSCFEQKSPEGFGAADHVRLVFLPGTDRRNAEKGEQFLEEPVSVVSDIFFHAADVLVEVV